MQNTHNHFSKVASNYRRIRTTDVEPIAFIGETLGKLREVKAADIGCGAGRYDLLLFQYINNLHLTCIDICEYMLQHLSDYLKSKAITNFKTIKADANDIPLENNSMDCILTFNAIHHFDFVTFMQKCSRVIRDDGRIFIYTRLKSQNERSVWGQYFPLFSEKEKRLYELDEMEQHIESVNSLRLKTAKFFKYNRNSTAEQLLEKVKTKHYSTFCLYEKDELAESSKRFQENLKERFQDTNQVEWFDENVLLVLEKI
ncbi:class I SAM-dependent methyltransferase [Thermodesulfobacteriota bacterium]